MKNILLSLFCVLGLIATVPAQEPTASPVDAITADPMPPAAPAATAPVSAAPITTPAISPAPSPADRSRGNRRLDDLEERIERKVGRHFNVTRTGGDGDYGVDEGALMAIPIVAIIFMTLFGAPVLIVGLIMFFSLLKARSLHRTVRMMVEKGQPVPEALFARPPEIRQRSDMRRGVVLVMVGLGIMLFLGAVNDWEGGAWAMGIIPFLIGAGYLAIWKLEPPKHSTDKELTGS